MSEDFKQLTLEGEEQAVEPGNNIPGQAEAARGKRYFFTYLAGRFPHIEDVFRLMAQGWDWRKAVYIAWLATPKRLRRPATQQELAVECLNLTSQRIFSNWRTDKSWPIEETAFKLARERATAPGPERLAAVVQALYETGAMVGREGAADRKLILVDMLGLGGDRPQEPEPNGRDLEQRANRINELLDRARARRDREPADRAA